MEQMASLEQEGTLDSIREEEGGSSPQATASCAGKVPKEDWSKMTRSQRRNYLRRRAEGRGGAPSVSGGAAEKRPRDVTDFTPSPNKEVRKRPKTEAPKYSHMVSCLKVAITKEDHPKGSLSEEQGNAIASKLVDLLRENNPEEGFLTFCGFTWRMGALIINCADEKSMEWLKATITKLSPWEGLRLRTCDPKELESFIRIAVFVPNPVSGAEAALGNIKSQNGLNTAHWKLLPGGVKVLQRGLFLAASIPESQFKVIETKNFKLACGLHLVEVKRLKEKPAPKETSKAEEVRREAGGMEAESAAVVAGVAAAGEPVAASRACPEPTGTDMRTEGFRQLPEGGGEPAAAGTRQDAASGSSAIGEAVEKTRCPRGKLDRGPPPS